MVYPKPVLLSADRGADLARWCRSLTVTPGTDLERFAKMQTSGADIVLYDLEDSVPADRKDAARRAFGRLRGEDLRRPLGLRVNSLATKDGPRDLEMLAEAEAQPLVVVVPKVASAEDIAVADKLLARAGCSAWIWALVESGAGVVNAHEIAQSSERLAALTFGSADFCAETGIAMKWEPLLYARSQVVLAARTAGVGVLDAPTFALDDPDLLATEAAAAAELGFTGKIAIHPKQVEVINAAFSPSPEQVRWATSVTEAIAGPDGSIATVDGQMVGPPFLRTAQRILTQTRRTSS